LETALSEEDVIKDCYMYSIVASEENASSGVRANDPLDAFEICLDEYQALPDNDVVLQASKFGIFLAPRIWGGIK